MVKGMKSILFLLLITVIFNLFLTPGTALVSFWGGKLQITYEGLRLAFFMALRLIFLIIQLLLRRWYMERILICGTSCGR